MDNRVSKEFTRWTASFTKTLIKIKQGSETPGCDIRLDQQECKDLVVALQVLRGGRDES